MVAELEEAAIDLLSIQINKYESSYTIRDLKRLQGQHFCTLTYVLVQIIQVIDLK